MNEQSIPPTIQKLLNKMTEDEPQNHIVKLELSTIEAIEVFFLIGRLRGETENIRKVTSKKEIKNVRRKKDL